MVCTAARMRSASLMVTSPTGVTRHATTRYVTAHDFIGDRSMRRCRRGDSGRDKGTPRRLWRRVQRVVEPWDALHSPPLQGCEVKRARFVVQPCCLDGLPQLSRARLIGWPGIATHLKLRPAVPKRLEDDVDRVLRCRMG